MILLVFSNENVNLTITSPSFILLHPPPKKRQMTLLCDTTDLRVAPKFLNSLEIRDKKLFDFDIFNSNYHLGD